MNTDKLETFYIEHHKKLLVIPLIFLLLAFGMVGAKYQATGDFLNKDVSLRGGLSATVYTNQQIDAEHLENSLPQDGRVRTLTDTATGQQVGIIVDISDIQEEEFSEFLSNYLNTELTQENYSVEETQASLGESFFTQLMIAMAFAFLFMGAVVFITFRSFVPSIAIIQAALTDIVGTLAIVNYLGMELSTAGIVAFLLVIGYSIDSDILLTTRVIKNHQGTVFDRMLKAAKTGLTMSVTTIAALSVGYFFATSLVLKQMFFIILVALVIDVFTTYLTNTGLLYMYMRKQKQ